MCIFTSQRGVENLPLKFAPEFLSGVMRSDFAEQVVGFFKFSMKLGFYADPPYLSFAKIFTNNILFSIKIQQLTLIPNCCLIAFSIVNTIVLSINAISSLEQSPNIKLI